jgi:hypothetical protein
MSKIQIKRYNGSTTSWENQFPITKAQHIRNNSDNDNIFDASDKIKIGYLPDAVFDSLLFTGVISSPSTASAVALAFEDGIQSASGASRSAVGIYFVLSASGTIAQQTTSIQTTLGDNLYYQWTFKNDDAGGTTVTSSGALEVGDWVVVTKISGTGAVGTPYILELAVVSNTFEDATTAVKGIVRLSDATTYASLAGNDVVTEGVLKATIDNASFAGSAHTHTLSTGATDVTATASELNLLDGELITTTELNYLAGVSSAIQTQLNGKASTSHTHTVANITDLTATATELNYVDGVTSAIQTQLNAKAPTANPTFTGTVVLPSTTSVGNVSSTELGYLDGVTSAIQTQLNAKQATITGGATSITTSDLTLNRALISDGSGKVAVSAVTSTELSYLSGVTSAVQTQLNSLSSRVRMYYDGTPTGMVTNDIWFDAV